MSHYTHRTDSGVFWIGERNGGWWVEHAGFASGPYPTPLDALCSLREGRTQLPGTLAHRPDAMFPPTLERWQFIS